MDRMKKPPAATGGEAGDLEYIANNISTPDVVLGLWNRKLRPVPCRGKKPYDNGWTTKVFDIRDFDRFDNVGIVLGDVIAIDIDVTDPDIAAKVEALALSSLGPSSCRVGRWPRRAMLYRAAEPMKKAASRSTAAGRIEVLGVGQQVVVAGTHPDTQQPYRWKGAPPWSPQFELATVTPSQVRQFLHEVEALLGLDPVEVVSGTTATATTPMPAPSIDTDAMPRAEDLAKALAGFWSTDAYDDWTTAGLALTGHPQGRELWMAWSATSPKHTDAEAAAKWAELSRSSRGDVRPDFILSKVPLAELQAWGKAHRIAELAADPAVAHGGEVADVIMPSRRAAPEAADDDEDHEHHDDDEAAHAPPQGHREAAPEHLLTVPGALGLAVDYYRDTDIRDRPHLAVLAALLFGAVCLGRRWRTDQSNFASIYAVAVARTGGGKEHVRRTVDRLLTAASLDRLIGPRSYASGPAIASAIWQQPCHIAIVDEFGLLLQEASSPHSHKGGAIAVLLEMFGLQDQTFRPTAYSTVGLTEATIKELIARKVIRPSLTLCGLSTPSTLLSALTAGDISSGLINRLLIVQDDGPLTMPRDRREIAVPETLATWAQYHASMHAGGGNLCDDNGPEHPPTPLTIPFSEEAKAVLKASTEAWIAVQNRDITSGELLVRAREIAMRIALIVSRSCETNEITAEAMAWAASYVDHHMRRLLEIAPRIGQTKWAQMVSEIGDAIAQAGGKGLTVREIGRAWHPWRGVKPQEQQALLQAVAADQGAELKALPTKQGRKRQAWVIPGRRAK